jgi:hypothetical protein
MVARWLVVFAKSLHAGGGHGVESGGLQINFKPIYRGHVATIDWATCRHPIRYKHAMSYANCPHNCLPCVVWPATSAYDLPCQRLYRLYGLYSEHPFFLPICHFEQNTISLAPDVRLNPNKLRWVHNNETYAPIQFEVIPSTLNFEQNLIPWITPPHWKACGPPKD